MEDTSKKIKSLKIAKGALTALSGTYALIPTPITAGLGATIAGISLDNEKDNNELLTVK